MTHSRESDVLTTHSLTSHFIGETSGHANVYFAAVRKRVELELVSEGRGGGMAVCIYQDIGLVSN